MAIEADGVACAPIIELAQLKAAAVAPAPVPAAEETRVPPRTTPNRAQLIAAAESEMSQPRRCPGCSRANPADAYYCHFDGKPLVQGLQPLPLALGSLPFPAPFCFSNGQACANFNQLAHACNHLWGEARELLKDGIWATFFASMGRLDLSLAAKQAATVTDADLGLSQLLEKFPADPAFLRPPQLELDCPKINLESLAPGTDYTFDLVIRNRGMLLFHGVVFSNFDWLVFGDTLPTCAASPGPLTVDAFAEPLAQGEHVWPREKLFQTRFGCTIPVLILGSKLRAGLKPLQGEIIVDSNGGSATVPVRVNIPVRPFPSGVDAKDLLAGVRSPRQLAGRARKSPHEAGLLFERGFVKAWYANNGWTYPIDGPDGQGAGAVQQFFEALGLTEPPPLEVDRASLSFTGEVGQSLLTHVTLRAQNAKPVYAQAWSDRDWVRLETPVYMGNKVRFPVRITVPAGLETTAIGQVTIQGNARQTFVISVAVARKSAELFAFHVPRAPLSSRG